MKLLLDTHVLLWWLTGSKQLSPRARALIVEPENVVFVSAATIWELRIKQALGQVTLPASFAHVLEAESFEALPITARHAHAVGDLPMHHRDPFDRLLVAQATIEGLSLTTHDVELERYDVAVELV
jgi:PIN domain nuclease of toxin-antitoxin system